MLAELIYILHILLVRAQVCKLIDTSSNVLQLHEDDVYNLDLNDYFIGEGLTFRLNEKFDYFQVSQEYGPGKISQKVKSITSFNLNYQVYGDVYAYFALVEVEAENSQYQIFQSSLSLNHQYSFTTKFRKPIDGDCYNIVQYNKFILITCFNVDVGDIEFYLYDPQEILEDPKILKYSLPVLPFQMKTLSDGKYICILIDYEDELESVLYIFSINDFPTQIEQVVLEKQINGVIGFDITDNFLIIVLNEEMGVFYYNLQEKVEMIKILEQYDEQYLGIKLNKASDYEYQLLLWNEHSLSLSLWNPQVLHKSENDRVYNDFSQITQENNQKTNIYVGNKYIIISNLEGISIYPSISNQINEAHLLYYYPVKSLFSSYDYINSILISVQESGVQTYIINNRYLMIKNKKQQDEVKQLTIFAKTNKYGSVSKDCPQLDLYYSVINVVEIKQQIRVSYYTPDNDYQSIFRSNKFDISKIFAGNALMIKQLQIENINSGALYNIKTSPILTLLEKEIKKQGEIISIAAVKNVLFQRNDAKNYFLKIKSIKNEVRLELCEHTNENCKLMFQKEITLYLVGQIYSHFATYNDKMYLSYYFKQLNSLAKTNVLHVVILQLEYDKKDDKLKQVKSAKFQVEEYAIQIAVLRFEMQENFFIFNYQWVFIDWRTKLIIIRIDAFLLEKRITENNFFTFYNKEIHIYLPFYNFKELGYYILLSIYPDPSNNDLKDTLSVITVIKINENSLSYVGDIKYKFEQSVSLSLQQIYFSTTKYGLIFQSGQINQMISFYTWQDLHLAILGLQQQKTTQYFNNIPRQQIFPNNVNGNKFQGIGHIMTKNFIYQFQERISDKQIELFVYKQEFSTMKSLHYIIKDEQIDRESLFVASFDDFDVIIYGDNNTYFQYAIINVRQEIDLKNDFISKEILQGYDFKQKYQAHITLVSDLDQFEIQEQEFTLPFSYNFQNIENQVAM